MTHETMAARRTRYEIKHKAIDLIAGLERLTNRAWEGMVSTRVTCPHCQQPYFPTDTPEWSAWSQAHAIEQGAIFGAVAAGDIPENEAAIKFGLTVEEIRNGIVLYNLRRGQEARDGHTQDSGREQERDTDAPAVDRAEQAPTGHAGGAQPARRDARAVAES